MVFSVISKWARQDALETAWLKVRKNNGRAGADMVSIAEFQSQKDSNLRSLQNHLQNGTYRPVQTFNICKTKEDGSVRWIRIPAVRDRIAQAACARAISDVFDAEMGGTSFAFRPGKSVESAAGRVAQLRLQGWRYGVRTDIRRFFDEIPIRLLMKQIVQALPCEGTEVVLRLWLRNVARYGRGIGQGSPLAPVLANCYLVPFDQALNQGRLRIIRYSDDILVLCKRRGDMDLSRFDAAPLIAFTAPKEMNYGTETNGRIPPRCGADCVNQRANA